MVEFYWSGYMVAFFLQIIALLIAFGYMLSIRAKNLRHMGMYFSISQGTFVLGKKPGFLGTLFSIFFSLFVESLLSWIGVIYRIYGYIKLVSNKISMPEKIKEIQFKLGSRILEKEEVLALFQELADFQGIKNELTLPGDEESEEGNILVLNDDNGWYAEIDIFDKENQRYYYHFHSPDYCSEQDDIYEYKIEGDTVLTRVTEKKTTHPGEEYYDIKDGVILKSEIIDRLKDDKFKKSDELISELEEETDWKETRHIEIKYFLLSIHPEQINAQEFKTILGKDLERIKLLVLKFEELCKTYNVVYGHDEVGYTKIESIGENEDKFIEELDLFEINNNCDRSEIFNSQERIRIISGYLE